VTLYLETNGNFIQWTGQAINDVLHPLDIEQRWPPEDLADIGLYIPADADAVPDGKVVASTSVELVEGVVKFINVLEDAPPRPVPPIISDRQFFQGLAINGTITQQEALDAVMTGTIPAALEGFIGQLPVEDQFAARMLLSGAVEFQRNHPMVPAVGAAFSWTEAQIDDFWRFCEGL